MEEYRYQNAVHQLIQEQLANGETITFRVLGESMHPFIREGDPIHVEQCNPRDLSMGDIITFKGDDLYLTHRVLWIVKNGNAIRLITRGDNEIAVDPPVSPNHILGKVVAIGRADRTLHLEARPWRFINRLLGVLFLMETFSILSYRLAAKKVIPFRTLVHATFKPSLLYRRLRNRGLGIATRVIM